jgi:hypothetical protein
VQVLRYEIPAIGLTVGGVEVGECYGPGRQAGERVGVVRQPPPNLAESRFGVERVQVCPENGEVPCRVFAGRLAAEQRADQRVVEDARAPDLPVDEPDR